MNVKSLCITGTSAVCGSALTTLGFRAFFRLSNFGFPHSKSLKSSVRSGWPLSHRKRIVVLPFESTKYWTGLLSGYRRFRARQ